METPHREIRFATTEDGVAIAYWSLGEGKPIVIMNPFGLCHSTLEWKVPSIAEFYLALAERFRVIRYDPRGFGLSADPPGGFGATSETGAQVGMSLPEMCLELDAVVRETDVDDFILIVNGSQGPVGLEYATTRAGSVSHLVLCEATAHIPTSSIHPLIEAQQDLATISQGLGTVSFNVWEKIVPPGEWAEIAELLEARHSDAEVRPVELAQYDWDARARLSEIDVPVLVVTARFPGDSTVLESRELAASIPGARLVEVDGARSPYFADRDSVVDAIHDLLGEPRSHKERARFRTVVFTDIVDSTRHIQRMGDNEGRDAVRRVEQQVSALAVANEGRVVKNLGDGSLVSFGSNSAALRFASDLQSHTDGPLQLRVGMAAGEPIEEDGDIHGTVVSQASRIAALGGPGEVVVSDAVRQLALGKGFEFEPMGDVELKGFDEPQRVWRLK